MIDPARLKSQLLNTGLQQSDPPLYQFLSYLINTLITLVANSNSSSSSSSSVVNNITQVLGGFIDGIDGIDGFPGPPGVNGIQGIQGIQGISGPPGMDGMDGVNEYYVIGSGSVSSSIKDTYAAPLTNGDANRPELVFDSFGDVVMVTGLT